MIGAGLWLLLIGLSVLATIAPPWWALIRHDEDHVTGLDVVGMVIGPWCTVLGLGLLVVGAWTG